jgi:hypothetical protein
MTIKILTLQKRQCEMSSKSKTYSFSSVKDKTISKSTQSLPGSTMFKFAFMGSIDLDAITKINQFAFNDLAFILLFFIYSLLKRNTFEQEYLRKFESNLYFTYETGEVIFCQKRYIT